MQRLWPRVREHLVRRARSAAAVFGEERVIALDGDTVVLGFLDSFKMEKAARDAARSMIEDVVRQVTGRPNVRVRCTMVHPEPSAPGAPDPKLPLAQEEHAEVTSPDEEFVQEVLATFDGELAEDEPAGHDAH